MTSALASIADLAEEYEFLEGDDRYSFLNELGKTLEPMPDALKTDATRVRGCLSQVWVYPTETEGGHLHFLADSNTAITKGIIALILLCVQDKRPADVLKVDIEGTLAPFNLQKHLTLNRTQGIPNMIALIRETAGRYS